MVEQADYESRNMHLQLVPVKTSPPMPLVKKKKIICNPQRDRQPIHNLKRLASPLDIEAPPMFLTRRLYLELKLQSIKTVPL